MFEPDHTFDARGDMDVPKLNQYPARVHNDVNDVIMRSSYPACQELQKRLKKGTKMTSEAISEHQI